MKKVLPYFLSLFILSACQKGNNDSVKSSEKNIGQVIFKVTDNPSLSKDVIGSLNGDSMKIVFSKNISLKNLIPTISFSGKSISPANKVPQDFTNPITYTITAEDGSTKRITFAGSNRTQSDSVLLLYGKWKVLRDSLSNLNFFFWEAGHYVYPTPGVYYGTIQDHYTFNENGTLNILENQNTYNATYALLSNNKLSIPDLDIVYTPASIITLTEDKLTVFWTQESTVSGGGHYGRMLYLVK
jgi:hypothetical protein